jgi:putative Mg2+ transporter-C (MgtC) family protein
MTHWTEWMIRSLRGAVPSPWLEVALALAAVVCGGIIGTERERHDKPAGLRTLILVCLGSAVFTMVSFAFTSTTGDSGRVAAQIVTGIGFLGAGAILHSRTSVSGMTTAAAIWMTAAIGISVGVGLPVAGLGASLLVRGVLAGVYRWEIRHLGGMKLVTVELLFDPDHGKTRIHLERIRESFHVTGQFVADGEGGNGWVRARMDLALPRGHLYEFLDALAELPAVREIREGGADPAWPKEADARRRDK